MTFYSIHVFGSLQYFVSLLKLNLVTYVRPLTCHRLPAVWVDNARAFYAVGSRASSETSALFAESQMFLVKFYLISFMPS